MGNYNQHKLMSLGQIHLQIWDPILNKNYHLEHMKAVMLILLLREPHLIMCSKLSFRTHESSYVNIIIKRASSFTNLYTTCTRTLHVMLHFTWCFLTKLNF